MYEIGARFANNFYIKTSIDPDSGDCYVNVEMITDEGVTITVSGQVTWDEGE